MTETGYRDAAKRVIAISEIRTKEHVAGGAGHSLAGIIFPCPHAAYGAPLSSLACGQALNGMSRRPILAGKPVLRVTFSTPFARCPQRDLTLNRGLPASTH